MRSATQGEKAALVQELRKEGHRLNDLLDAIRLSRSTYYYELSKTDKVRERNADLSSEIVSIFNENRKRYGVRRVHHELLNRGFQVNHKRVQRVMNQLELFGKRPKEKYHSYKGDVGKVADNIINRNFSTEKPLQKWTTDVSQFNLSWGKCYISPILDMNTNEIISYNLSTSPNMEQIKDMLNKAFERFLLYKVWSCTRIRAGSTSTHSTAMNFRSTESFNPCPERATVTTTALWKPSLAD